MLKRIIHLFFIISGGTIGYLYFPTVIKLLGITETTWYTTSYFGIVVGAILFFILSIFSADYVVEVLKWIEEGLVKIPVIDLLLDRKSTRLNSSHVSISYAVFCLKKKNNRVSV